MTASTTSTPAARAAHRLPRVAARGLGIVGGLGLGALAWGSVERRLPVLRHARIPLPEGHAASGMRILHIADLHLHSGEDFLVDFVGDLARTTRPDLVVSTGDNLGTEDTLDAAIEAHAHFDGVPGLFVFGSNDYYSPRRKNWARYLTRDARTGDHLVREPDLPHAELADALTDMGWVDLRNTTATVDVPARWAAAHARRAEGARGPKSVRVSVMGVDDPHIDLDRMPATPEDWAGTDMSVLRLALTHAPYLRIVNHFTDVGAELILAGHTHGGQFGLPFVPPLVTNCDLPRRWGKGAHMWRSPSGACAPLHVSAGLGTSPVVPFRIFVRPEATLLELV